MTTKLSAAPTPDMLVAAYDKHVSDFHDLPDTKLLLRVNFDFTAAVAVVLGAQPLLLEHRATIRDHLPMIPLRYIDELDTIAHAALYAYTQAQATQPESKLSALADDCRARRRQLHADAVAAMAHDLMPEDALHENPTGNGRLEIAQGLLGLCVAFRTWWHKVKGQTAVTEALLREHTSQAVELLAALGRDENPATQESQRRDAQWLRAASYFYHAYDQCRRAMGYVRWDEGDASDYAPALVGTRGPRTRSAPEAPEPDPAKGGGTGGSHNG